MDVDLRKQMVITLRAMYFILEEHWAILTRDYNISSAQQHILYILLTYKNPLSISQISRIGCWHISTVTRLLKPLIQAKYVVVYHRESNSKTKYIKLTESGMQIIYNVLTTLVHSEDFPYDLSSFTEDEVRQFLQMGQNILQKQKGPDYIQWVKEAEIMVN